MAVMVFSKDLKPFVSFSEIEGRWTKDPGDFIYKINGIEVAYDTFLRTMKERRDGPPVTVGGE